MKTFDTKKQTTVFDIEEFLNKDFHEFNAAKHNAECINLLGNAWKEIKLLRRRLEIDRVYKVEFGSGVVEHVEQKTKDNSMLGCADKIVCLKINIDCMCEEIMQGDAKDFVKMNFPKQYAKYNQRKV